MKGRILATLTVTAALITGCGGTDEYDAQATLQCLDDAGFASYSTDKADLDLIAEAYAGNAARFEADGGEVHVIVTATESEAQNAKAQYEMFIGEGNNLEQRGNAVIAANAIEAGTLDTIHGCLTPVD